MHTGVTLWICSSGLTYYLGCGCGVFFRVILLISVSVSLVRRLLRDAAAVGLQPAVAKVKTRRVSVRHSRFVNQSNPVYGNMTVRKDDNSRNDIILSNWEPSPTLSTSALV